MKTKSHETPLNQYLPPRRRSNRHSGRADLDVDNTGDCLSPEPAASGYRLTVNDLMPAARGTADAAGAEFLEGDVRNIIWPDAPDLIVSASTIQWLEAPEALVQRAALALAPGGWLALSGFGPAQFSELCDLGSSAPAPGLRSPGALADVIRASDTREFDIVEFGENRYKSWFETPKHVLRHLRETGVNATVSRVWTRAQLAQFSDAYSQTFGEAKGVPLTYHPTWVIARKCG